MAAAAGKTYRAGCCQQGTQHGLSEQINVTGAGRTDTGVHASFFCAHFDSARDDIDADGQLLYNLNSLLPDDIAVSRIARVQAGCQCPL